MYIIEKFKLSSEKLQDALFSRGTYLEFEDGNMNRPIVKQREWLQQRFHFDDVAKAMLTLFTVSTFEGWPS